MATALITIDQLTNISPIGVPGRARNDLDLSQPVTFRNANNTDVNRWRWALLDWPLGSTATLSSVTAPQVTFTPDVPGSYRVRLTVNDALAGQSDTKIGAVLDDQGRRYPATGERAVETNWLVGGSENDNGWGKDAERILRSLGAPQLLHSADTVGIPAASASEHVIVGALGLPATTAAITGYDFVDLQGGANVGGPPTVNGVTLTEALGDAGLAAICVGDWDMDTSACVAADLWAFIVITDVTFQLLAQISLT